MIFGVGYPVVKIVATSVVYELKYANIEPTFIDKRSIENESPITGERQWIDLFNQAEFEVLVHLHSHLDPKGYFNTLRAVEDALVYFRPHKYITDRSAESDYMKDAYGLLVPFKCSAFEPFYLDNINHFDCLKLTFKSSKPISLQSEVMAMLPKN